MKTKLVFLYSFTYAFVNLAEAIAIFATAGIYSPGWIMSFAAWHTKLTIREKMRTSASIANVISDLRSAFPLLDNDGLDEKEHCCEWSIQQERSRLHALLERALVNIGGAK